MNSLKYIICLIACSRLFGYDGTETLYGKIAQENLKSLITVEEERVSLEGKKFYEILQQTVKEHINPKSEVKRRLAFTLLSHYERKHNLTRELVLDDRSWLDLEMLCGPNSHPQLYLAAKIDRTSTEIGRLTLFRKIIQPLSTIQGLLKQQEVVKEFVANSALFEQLDTLLKELPIPENALFSFWDEKDIFKNSLDRDLFTMPLQERIMFLKNLSTALDTNEFFSDARERLDFIITAGRGILMTVGSVTLPLYGLSLILENKYPWLKEKKFMVKNTNNWLGIKGALSMVSISGFIYFIINSLYDNKFTEAGENITAGLSGGLIASKVKQSLHVDVVFNKCLQEKLIYVSTYFSTMKKIFSLINSHESLKNLLPHIHALSCRTLAPEVERLLNLLDSTTFKGKPSFFSFTGKILVTYKLLHKYKDELIDLLAVVGELDMYMSIARLYKEFEHQRVCYCFPEYCTGAVSPSLEIENFWNPLIVPTKVIPNSLVLGAQGQRRNAVITGPNAGGKSTVLKGIIVSIILAQSIGIAPAQRLIFTPFTSITTYLNITDDIAAGNSLFKAGVLRARELLTRVERLDENEFAFTAVDEVFNGTRYQEGQAAAYTLLKMLGASSQNICLTATHFPLITKLEQETDTFANYKVAVEGTQAERIHYPYKLEKGISNQIITFKILQEEGFSDVFLTEAQDVLARTNC